MDPNRIQNHLNPMNQGQQQPGNFIHPQQQQQYNQIFAQNQIFGSQSMPFYNNQQMFEMQQYMQPMFNQQLLQHQQMSHHSQMLQQQQHHAQFPQQVVGQQIGVWPVDAKQAQQGNLVVGPQSQQPQHYQHHPMPPQQQQPPPPQSTTQQPQQQLSHHQRLLEQQKQQMEASRQQRLAQERAEQAKRDAEEEAKRRAIEEQKRAQAEENKRRAAEEAERLKREALERKARLEAERLEKERQAQEAARKAEEERIRREKEERERRKLEKVQAENRARKADADKHRADMDERNSRIPGPLSILGFVGTDLWDMIRVPRDPKRHETALPKILPYDVHARLNQVDDELVTDVCEALRTVDITKVKFKKAYAYESNDLNVDALPPFMKAILDKQGDIFDVDVHSYALEDSVLNEAMNTFDAQPSTSDFCLVPATPMMRPLSPQHHLSTPVAPVIRSDIDQAALRRQMVSLGKQPKAATNNNRKKKDMVEELYDSLTDYFDPTQGRRTRRRAKTFEEEQLEKKDMELIQQLQEESENGAKNNAANSTHSEEEEMGKFFDKKRGKKRKHDDSERPPTPTEVIEKREAEWRERQKQRYENQRKRLRGDDSGDEDWSHDVMAEQASQECFESTIDEIVMDADIDFLNHQTQDDDDGGEIDAQFLIDAVKIDLLRVEAQKLKQWRKLNKISVDRIVKLITILERNIRDVIPREGEAPIATYLDEDMIDEDDPTTRELIDDRLNRAASAACTTLIVMTGAKMPKQVFNEDAIERSIQLCKQYLHHIVFPSSDSVFRATKGKKIDEKSRGRRKAGQSSRTPTAQRIYMRMSDLIGCFAELIRILSCSDMAVHQLCSIATSSFFVNNIGDVQWQAMKLLSNIFHRYDDNIRHAVFVDIINMLHRIPASKTTSNSLRLSNGVWLSNVTVLIMQLVQSIIEVPKRRKKDDEVETNEKAEIERGDRLVKASFESATRLAAMFLSGFLQKCCAKGEDDNRRVFEAFLNDLLNALHKPEWPAAEFLLTLLGNMLVKHYRTTKGADIALRTASLEYLGMITARLKKDVKAAATVEVQERLELVTKTLVYEEMEDPPEDLNISDVDISHLSSSDRLKKLEQSLIDFLLLSKDGDVSVEYAISFYAGLWYRDTAEDIERMRKEFKAEKRRQQEELNEKELRKKEKRLEKLEDKGRAMKEYFASLVDKRLIRKRVEHIRRNGLNIMLESDAAWTVKYLASRRELSVAGFENYLKQILFGVISEPTVSLRTRAMKCLTQIIEADSSVLGIQEVQNAVQARMVDPNAQVREATIELLGRYLMSRPDFIPKYYPILLERIKDSGTAVRKRVIRIMRELTERYPSLDKVPEMLSRIVRRVGDEEGVKKLVVDTFHCLWFTPLPEREQRALIERVKVIVATTELCSTDSTVEHIEVVLNLVFKLGEKGTLPACKQIVDCLVDNILALESTMALDSEQVKLNSDGTPLMNGAADIEMQKARVSKTNQDRMLASLTALSVFSKVKPELLSKHAETLQPYLSMTANTPLETQVLKQVIDMLARIMPLMSHPSDEFIDSLENSLTQLVVSGKVVIVESAVGCAGALHEKFPRRKPHITEKFLKFLSHLNAANRMLVEKGQQGMPENAVVMLARSIFCCGILTRYFNFDIILENEPETVKQHVVPTVLQPDHVESAMVEDDGKPRSIRDNVFSVLFFFSTYPHGLIRKNAIIGLGHLCAQHAEYLTRTEIRNMYMTLLRSIDKDFLALKICALRNLEQFLIAEEQRMMKTNEDWQKRRETEDLKEMDQAGSGLGSAVIQIYWNYVLNCYFHYSPDVRVNAVQVAWRTLNQGLVTPGSSIPTLIAMTTDPLLSVRNKIENLLKEIDIKYQGMVQSKAVAGVRVAFKLHSMIHGGTDRRTLRGIRALEGSATANTAHRKTAIDDLGMPRYANDGQALLSGLYQAMRTNRQQRRSFMTSVLRLFADDCREKLSISEWIFVADNIAMFPYQTLDEPLYVIHQIDSIVAISGESIINQFKAHLLPKTGYDSEQNDDDVDFVPEAIYRRMPDNKSYLFELMNHSQSCFILLYLKSFLMKLYGFTDAKVQEYSPLDNAKLYEKTVGRKNVHMFFPQSAIAELDDSRIQERDSLQGHINLANRICEFRKMLLSLDRGDEDDDDIAEETPVETETETTAAPNTAGEDDMDESDLNC